MTSVCGFDLRDRDSKQPIVVARLGVESSSRAVEGRKKASRRGRSTEGQDAWSVCFTQEKLWAGRKVSVFSENGETLHAPWSLHAGFIFPDVLEPVKPGPCGVCVECPHPTPQCTVSEVYSYKSLSRSSSRPLGKPVLRVPHSLGA